MLEMNRPVYIYGLYDPSTNILRYVGKTLNPRARFNMHMSTELRRADTYKSRWIKKLLSNGYKPTMKVLEITDEENWSNREFWWIDTLKSVDHPLVNTSVDGQGAGGVRWSTQTRELRKQNTMIRRELRGLSPSPAPTKSRGTPEWRAYLVDASAKGKITMKARATSKYSGVSKGKKDSSWRTHIRYLDKQLYIGAYQSEHTAALAYNAFALLHSIDISLNSIDFTHFPKAYTEYMLTTKKSRSAVATSEHKYISLDTKSSMWRVRVPRDGATKWVGRYATEEEAVIARDNYLQEEDTWPLGVEIAELDALETIYQNEFEHKNH